MVISIKSNIASLTARRSFDRAVSDHALSSERLASGMRINRASDDAAGLAVSNSLTAQRRLYSQAVRNANDGLSALSIADGALNELSSIVTRIAELAEQSANGVYSTTQRVALNKEAQAMRNEFNRVVVTTKFNGIELLNGGEATVLQVGINGEKSSQITNTAQSAVSRIVGDGTFNPQVHYVIPGGRAAMFTVADFNADGRDDIVEQGNSGGALVLMLANADGTFNVQTLAGNSGNALSNAADIDGDGDLDFGVRLNTAFRFYRNNGNGTFNSSVYDGSESTDTDDSHLADVNGDGKVDLIRVRGTPTDEFLVSLGNGDGTFTAGVTHAYGGTVGGVDFEDMNGDGNVDIYNYPAFSTYLTIRTGRGDGTFNPITTVSTAYGSLNHATVGDVNNDGLSDVVFTTGYEITLRLANQSGGYNTEVLLQTDASGDLAGTLIRDINEDGFADMFIQDDNTSTMYLRISNGDGSFRAQVSVASGFGSTDAEIGDFNGDGALDFASATGTSVSIEVLLANPESNHQLAPFNITTQASARQTLDAMRSALQSINESRSIIGAAQSRLMSAVRNQSVAADEMAAANSRIMDVDVAQEAARSIAAGIREQVGALIIRQANLIPELALTLLR